MNRNSSPVFSITVGFSQRATGIFAFSALAEIYFKIFFMALAKPFFG
jgi:hypothetical protein